MKTQDESGRAERAKEDGTRSRGRITLSATKEFEADEGRMAYIVFYVRFKRQFVFTANPRSNEVWN